MPDLRDDTTEDGFHEIQLSRKQLVFLFMMASVALIFVFLVGVVIGRDTATRGTDAPVASRQDLPAMASANPTVEAPAPAPESSAPPATAGGLSYPDILADDKNKPRSGEKGPQAPAPAPTVETPAATAPVGESPPAVPEKPAPEPAAKTATSKVPTSGRPGAWVIQVSAFKTQQPAAEAVQRLRRAGYDAFLETPARGLYRVRIGRFKERTEAERVARRLEKEGTKSVISR